MRKTEVLAPAGSMEALVAAVRSGADAVYLGAKQFSARRNAENFDFDALCEAVAYCRIRSVAVYLTLNIMLKNSELDEALDTVRMAVKAGISGVIVQDLGLARIVHSVFPDLPLHASTQMSVNSVSALPVLKKLGFCRVVTAREMSREELKNFCIVAKELGIEVEVFVHGALCMCVSGQCLMSAVLGGRSGNRGLCAGPCRLPFEAQNGTGYDLSLKDLSLISYLEELSDMGVNSFKIEGRMKRPEYVAAATAAARAAVDGMESAQLLSTLRDVFSRSGFTDGYYTGQKGRGMFGIRTRDDVMAAGDAIPKLHELYRNERQCVPVTVGAKIIENQPIEVTFNQVKVVGEIPQKAANRPCDAEYIKKSLLKLGGTPYFAESFKAEVGDGLFVSASSLNELRRKAVAEFDRERSKCESIAEYTRPVLPRDIGHSGAPSLVARFASIEALPDDLSGLRAVVLPVFCEIPDGIEVIAELPRRIRDENALKNRLLYLSERGVKTALCGNLAAVELSLSVGMQVVGDIGLNVCNSESIAVLKELGLLATLLSAETDIRDAISMISPIPKGIFAYGRMPLMLLENCPLKNGRECSGCDKKGYITDRKGVKFPVRCTGGVSELLNSVPIWLADRMGELSGTDFLYLRFDDESPDAARRIIDAYLNGEKPTSEYTRGLYFREVL